MMPIRGAELAGAPKTDSGRILNVPTAAAAVAFRNARRFVLLVCSLFIVVPDPFYTRFCRTVRRDWVNVKTKRTRPGGEQAAPEILSLRLYSELRRRQEHRVGSQVAAFCHAGAELPERENYF
jgi:hypothetical protein